MSTLKPAPERDDTGQNTTTLAVFWPILAILYMLGFTNLFLRSSFGVMSPDLAREMDMAPAALSLVGSAFFFAYALMQVPTGMLLDRFGPRRTLAIMLISTFVGAGIFAAGETPGMLAVGRVLMGIGCAGVFTGAFYVMTLWMPPDRVVTQIGMLNSFASFGNLCATAPLAFLIAWIGWRTSYWGFTIGVALLTLAVALVMRDTAPGQTPTSSKDESLRQIFAGVREAIRQPGMKRLLVAGLPMSAASTISGVWGAPYLKHVHGLDDGARGSVLLAMAVCGMSGHFLYGQLARRFNTLKWPIIGGSSVILCCTGLFALIEQPPLWLVTVLFAILALVSAYPTITHAHARGLVPARLMGRGVSVTNMGVMTAIATAQLAFGGIVGLLPTVAGAPPEAAYRLGFAMQAIVALTGILIYAPIRDVRPRG